MGTQKSIKVSMGTEKQKDWEPLLSRGTREAIKVSMGTEEENDWEHLL